MIAIGEPLFARLLQRTPFSPRELLLLIATAPNRYKDHFIEKRHGRGLRLISQPTAEVKLVQRAIIEHEFHDLPIHDAAVAYRRGRSIADHASPHASARYLLKLDFKDFFPSLKEVAFKKRISELARYSDQELIILTRLLLRRGQRNSPLQLSIGAPSSPFVSNYIMGEFDSLVSDYCAGRGVRYTRYADDLAFSTSAPHVLDDVLVRVRGLLDELDYLGLDLNESKTVNVSTKHNRTLAGLTLSNQGSVSIGRDEKRRLRATMHAYANRMLSTEEAERLAGQLAFVFSVDPEFVTRLCQRHGIDHIKQITRSIGQSSKETKS